MTEPTSETTTPAEKATPKYGVNDTVTISRGNKRGQTGKVVGIDADHEQYAVNLDSGAFTVVSYASVKPPVEKSFTLTEVADLLTRHGIRADSVLAEYQADNQTPALD
jgi:hypothetical protein